MIEALNEDTPMKDIKRICNTLELEVLPLGDIDEVKKSLIGIAKTKNLVYDKKCECCGPVIPE